MSAEHLTLPPGTALVISESQIDFLLRWEGRAGQHVVHLQQTVEWDESGEREMAIARAVVMFCNAVGLEVIADALTAGECPALGDEEADGNESGLGDEEEGVDPWGRTKET